MGNIIGSNMTSPVRLKTNREARESIGAARIRVIRVIRS